MNLLGLHGFRFSTVLTKFLSVVAIMLTAGCSVVEVYNESRYFKGSEGLPADAFDQIKPGITSKAWVLDYLGEPAKIKQLENAEEHWLYPLLIEHKKGGRIILLYSGMTVNQEFRNFHLLFDGGVVSKAWYSNASETFDGALARSNTEVADKMGGAENMAAEPLVSNLVMKDSGIAASESLQPVKKSVVYRRNKPGPKR